MTIYGLARDGTPAPPTPAPPTPAPTATATAQVFGGEPTPVRAIWPPAVERWRSLVAGYAWDLEEALSVIACESGGLAVQSYTGGPYFGLFQLWEGHFLPGEDWRDGATNIAVAYRVWAASGWDPWDARCQP